MQLPQGSRWVSNLTVKLQTSGKEVTVSRSKHQYTFRNQQQYTKKTFPLMLAYAMTAHRFQGATLTGRVILHVRRAFAPAIVYVMLSRATQRSNLRIIGDLSPRDFVPVNEAAFAAWEANQQAEQEKDGEGEGEGDGEDSNEEAEDVEAGR
jgi:ATP-dependent exoDNAse (exonuclease V) alpha subunit